MNMAAKLLVVALAAVPVFGAFNSTCDPDNYKTTQQLVTEKGYPMEEHTIQTRDGYLLGTFRIPYGRKENRLAKLLRKPPVLLMHALLDSSYSWTAMYENQGLPYILADAGYDVWMPNNRGTRYSRKNVHFSDKTEEFWNFTYDELGKYDVPDSINYILKYTNKPQLAFVGHSQGCTEMYSAAHFDVNKELSKTVALFGALGPALYEGHATSPIFVELSKLKLDEFWVKYGTKEFLTGNELNKFTPEFCCKEADFCKDAMDLICGQSTDLNASHIQVHVSGAPAGTSSKNMAHWAQALRTDRFGMYDYGSDAKNQAAYGRTTPPQYDLSKLEVPTVLYSGSTDTLADPTDVRRVVAEMNPAYIVEDVVIEGYAHMDFTWGMTAHQKVYEHLLKQIAKYLGPGRKQIFD